MKENYKFCFRLSTAWKDAVELVKSNNSDNDFTLKRRSNRDLGKIREYDIPLEIKGLRLVCIELSSGEKDVLLTNLTDRKNFTLNDLKQLYHMRWSVEEGFKSFKKSLHLEHFTGKTTIAIKQHFYAKVFITKLIEILSKRLEIIRPGRSFKRPDTSIRRRHKGLTSKGI